MKSNQVRKWLTYVLASIFIYQRQRCGLNMIAVLMAIVIHMISVQLLYFAYCFVIMKSTLQHFLLLGNEKKQL